MEIVPEPAPTIRRQRARDRWWRIAGYGLFWTWHVIYLLFFWLGFVPIVLPGLSEAVLAGLIPLDWLVPPLILGLVPIAGVALGATVFRRRPRGLLALGYGVEAPVLILVLVRFLALREATPLVALLLGLLGVGVLTLLWQLLDTRLAARAAWLKALHFAGAVVLLGINLYAALWLAFYALPVLVGGLRGAVEAIISVFRYPPPLDPIRVIPSSLFAVLGIALLAFTATLFFGMPVTAPVLAIRAWRRAAAMMGRRTLAGLMTLMGLIAIVLAFVVIGRQTQPAAYALLKEPPRTLAAAQALAKEDETIRQGLLNAYLAPYRYTSAAGDDKSIENMYRIFVGFPDAWAERIQDAYDAVAQPFVYAPSGMSAAAPQDGGRESRGLGTLQADSAAAERLYQRYFDAPINKREREAVVRSVRSTWSGDQAQQAWQAVDEHDVRLVTQTVTLSERGAYADVELYEVYQNETPERQEVVYYFSLPESAVVTGLWLGTSSAREGRSTFRVSPRGAAQQVYVEQVQQRVDPALLEQVGPRQYRLRVFPIEPARWSSSGASRENFKRTGPELHLWMTWRVLAQDRVLPLAQLAEHRNVYWDARSAREINGKRYAGDDWMPASVPATTAAAATWRVDFANGQTVIAEPKPMSSAPALPRDLRLAVVVDRSRSMRDHAAEVDAAIARLRGVRAQGASVTVFLTASEYRGEPPLALDLDLVKPPHLDYVGGQKPSELLAQFEALRGTLLDKRFDAVLMLTDEAGFELGDAKVTLAPSDAPLWMAHLGGKPSLGYDDATLQVIQGSGGGAAGSVEEALARIAIALDRRGAPGAPVPRDWADGYLWTVMPTESLSAPPTLPDDDPLAAVAARRLILAEMYRGRANLGKLATLDQLHAIARKQGIVTPYSSMIVLVNAQQEKRLDTLEGAADRFEREAERVGTTVPTITAVPEPHEWLLLGLVGLYLVWTLAQRRRRGLSASRERA